MHWNYNTLRSILKLASVCAVMAVATEAPAHLAPIWGTVLDEYNRQIGHIVFCTAAQVSVPSGHVAVSALGGPLFAGIDKYNTQIARTVPCTAPYLIAIRLPQGIAESFASEPVLKEKATSPF